MVVERAVYIQEGEGIATSSCPCRARAAYMKYQTEYFQKVGQRGED